MTSAMQKIASLWVEPSFVGMRYEQVTELIKANQDTIDEGLRDAVVMMLKGHSPEEVFVTIDKAKSLASRYLRKTPADVFRRYSIESYLRELEGTAICNFCMSSKGTVHILFAQSLGKDREIGYALVEAVPDEMAQDFCSKLEAYAASCRDSFPDFTLQQELLEVFARVIIPFLVRYGIPHKLIFIPHKLLHVLPFHAMSMKAGGQEIYLDGLIPFTTYTSSLHTLLYSSQLDMNDEKATISNKRLSIMESKTGLPWIPIEQKMVEYYKSQGIESDLFTSRGEIPTDLGSYASINWSSHGQSDPSSWEGSFLTSNEERISALTIGTSWHLSSAPIVVLPNCEAKLTLPNGHCSDEYCGLDMGFKIAGAGSVFSTFWKTSDLVITLANIILRDWVCSYRLPVSHAAVRFQAGLRLGGWYEWMLTPKQIEQMAHGNRQVEDFLSEIREQFINLPQDAFAHPKDWAAFRCFGDGGIIQQALQQKFLETEASGRKDAFATETSPALDRSDSDSFAEFPVKRPAHWNVPFKRNPYFTGRRDLLSRIQSNFNVGKRVAVLTSARKDLRGVGKSQIAVEYAYRYSSNYDLVWWIRAENSAILLTDYTAIATELDLDEAVLHQQRKAIAEVRKWLSHNTRWLLVFDNANNIYELNDYMPKEINGHVIITSRNSQWTGEYMPVGLMEEAEALSFLLKRTSQEHMTAPREFVLQISTLPMVLAQAGAYIKQEAVSFSDYLTCIPIKRGKLVGTAFSDIPTILTLTGNLAYQRALEIEPLSGVLLEICSFLAPENIYIELLMVGAELYPTSLSQVVQDKEKLRTCIDALQRYSLVDMVEGKLSMHELTQDMVRKSLSEEKKKEWLTVAARLISGTFPNDTNDVRALRQCESLLPHAIAVVKHAEEEGTALEEAGWLLNHLGLYHKSREAFTESETAFLRSSDLFEKALGPDHPHVAASLFNLAQLHRERGQFQDAEELLNRIIEIHKQFFGPDHPHVATSTL